MLEKQRFAVSTSTEKEPLVAVREASARVRESLAGLPPDLALVFFAGHDPELVEGAAEELCSGLEPRTLIGCTVESAVAGRVEHEGVPAVAVWGAVLPGAEVRAAHLRAFRGAGGVELSDLSSFSGQPAADGQPGADGRSALLVLADPFSFPADLFLEHCREAWPGAPVFGGMASGAAAPGANRLVLVADGGPLAVFQDGATVVSLTGARIESVVSQGARPFGKTLVVTGAEENILTSLGGQPALARLQEQLAALSADEQALLARGLHLGIAIDASKRRHERGDFLVRNVLGIHKETRGIVVAERLRLGQTVQFHLRDADSASEDLHLLLKDLLQSRGAPAGGLLFSCNGRGTRLFAEANHDAAAVARELGEIPLAGFFAAGELGPVGGRNFLHGFTASLALFYED
jgi:small ligand-binding sensory domain FIST